MKMKQEHFEHVKTEVEKTIEENGGLPWLVSQYENGHFNNADKTRDISKRFRWDCFHAAGLTKYACSNLYDYLDDTHIDTALRQIIPHKLIKAY